jgi:hypothetical protein
VQRTTRTHFFFRSSLQFSQQHAIGHNTDMFVFKRRDFHASRIFDCAFPFLIAHSNIFNLKALHNNSSLTIHTSLVLVQVTWLQPELSTQIKGDVSESMSLLCLNSEESYILITMADTFQLYRLYKHHDNGIMPVCITHRQANKRYKIYSLSHTLQIQ